MHFFYTTCLLTCLMSTEIFGFTFQTHFGRTFGELRGKRGAFGVLTGRLESMAQENANGRLATPEFAIGSRSADSVLIPTSFPQLTGPTTKPLPRSAKKFWNHFILRRRSEFQSILTLRNNEVHQHKCRALSFSQRVRHEGCETLVLKNNVCFGKCSSAHTATGEGDSSACSLCSPVKFTRKTVQLKCRDDAEVTKVVTMVEDCQCEENKGRHHLHHNGPVLIDPSIGNQA